MRVGREAVLEQAITVTPNDTLTSMEQIIKGDVDDSLSVLLVEPHGVFAASMN